MSEPALQSRERIVLDVHFEQSIELVVTVMCSGRLLAASFVEVFLPFLLLLVVLVAILMWAQERSCLNHEWQLRSRVRSCHIYRSFAKHRGGALFLWLIRDGTWVFLYLYLFLLPVTFRRNFPPFRR